MVAQPANSLAKPQNGRTNENGASSAVQTAKPAPGQKAKETMNSKPKYDSGLKDYQLGDCLGKGAFGSVYRALNWGTGETVAVKQIKLDNLPKSELHVITLEINLLKNLHHPNIVKYHGSVKTAESLYIILEYCENGSLHSICKNFGKFPENLVALYMSQVLHGLLYLHEQGVIHRDIKGANILTTKEGLVKLADFGVATKATGLHESSVVGTPYWMAPEVIELAGATTASDIWSLGCTVIELLDGKPPYHKLQPMPALFRIVNDDHPPLPESASPTVEDFLLQCFQKDPNLRVTARKLLKHPWIVNAKRVDAIVPEKPTKYDEAVKTVQQWNEALKSPEGTLRRDSRANSASPAPVHHEQQRPRLITPALATKNGLLLGPHRPTTDQFRSPDEADNGDNWDDDFASSIGSTALQLPAHLRPVDHYDGKLSPEKLKAYATTNEPPSGSISRNSSINHDAVAMPREISLPDPMETVRPPSPEKIRAPKQRRESMPKMAQRQPSQPKTQILRGLEKGPTQPLPKQQPQVKPVRQLQALKRSSSLFREEQEEDYSDLVAEDDSAFDQKMDEIRHAKTNGDFSPTFPHVSDLKNAPRSAKSLRRNVSRLGVASETTEEDDEVSLQRIRSSAEIQKYAEKTEDEDFSDIFGADETILGRADSESGSDMDPVSVLNSKFSSHSWLIDRDDEEDDPFAQLEENLDEMDLETKVARDRHSRLCTLVESLVGSLKTTQPDEYLADVSDQLMQILLESPDMKSVVISSHGLLPILEVLDSCQRRDVSFRLLKIINTIIADSVEVQETLCFVGGIPIVTKFAYKRYSSEVRLEAAAFVRQMYQSSMLTLQMFISCGGLNVLVEFLEEDYDAERDLVIIGVNGMWSVFQLQGPTPKNDFCRIFSRSSALYPLSQVLNKVLDEDGELAELVQGRIVNIFLIFSQAENHVKESIAERMILKSVLKDLRRMIPAHQVTMLKFLKNLSMLASTLESLQNSNAIEVLTDLLGSSIKFVPIDDTSVNETANQIVIILFNLCRLSKTRQEDAALNGVIPLLLKTARGSKPLKHLSYPILCDMAHSGKVCRKILWQNKGLNFYIELIPDIYWGASALDAIFIWLQEETAKVEEYLTLHSSFSEAVTLCMKSVERHTFENVLDPLQKLLRLSPPVAATLIREDFIACLIKKLQSKKAVIRGNLLRIVRSICEGNGDHGALMLHFGLNHVISRLADTDPAILVRNMAADLVTLGKQSQNNMDEKRYRRASSTAMTPPSVYSGSSSSLPPTPQASRSSVQSPGYFDLGVESSASRPRMSNINGSTPLRPATREGPKPALESTPGSTNGTPSGPKSRLPRTNFTRLNRSNTSSKREENMGPLSTPASQMPAPIAKSSGILNPRKRRQTSGASGA